MLRSLSVAVGVGLAASLLPPSTASACGCFALPSPDRPLLQAAERIVFAHRDGVVEAHIQIQYQGPAEEFGWLLPMPSEPEVGLSTEVLFDAVQEKTEPSFQLNRIPGPACFSANTRLFGGDSIDSDAPSFSNPRLPDPVVRLEAVGPYETAVLRADDGQALRAWLEANGYFVPGDDALLAPYIRPGAYFLALKLRKDADVGQIQPVRVLYPSDYPQIPIVLTAVSAVDDMSILVWVLGEARAIPRNFNHTVLNLEHISWQDGGLNYPEVVGQAVDESSEHHSFVTEYAGPTSIMDGSFRTAQDYGDLAALAALAPLDLIIELLRRSLWGQEGMDTLLRLYFPLPEVFEGEVEPRAFYADLSNWMVRLEEQHPEAFAAYVEAFDDVGFARDLEAWVILPLNRPYELFQEHPKLTRLYTVLSPEEMTEDPTFAWNPDLPDISNVHTADLERDCDGDLTIILPDGRRFDFRTFGDLDRSEVPYSLRIEHLREEGAPEVQVDNLHRISPGLGCGCDSRGRGSARSGLTLLLLLLWPRRRRR